ncbi:MAG: hydroxymethylbilane synthase [Bacteroidota bacterium]
MSKTIKIGTRESQLALWQANEVKRLLEKNGHQAELVLIKSEGDIDLVTPLYELGVQGVFTKALDASLLSGHIDIAVHSMKDVPTLLAKGIIQASILPRASYTDIIVPKHGTAFLNDMNGVATIATSSIRRKAQWLNRYPNHSIDNLRGNVNTRLRKVQENEWAGAIFAAAGLDRINLRPDNAVVLDWMLPAPAQGAVMVVCREGDTYPYEACHAFNDEDTAICVQIERDFLRTLLGGCSTPISALAKIEDGNLVFRGSVLTLDGKQKAEVSKTVAIDQAKGLGIRMAEEILNNGGQVIVDCIRNAG